MKNPIEAFLRAHVTVCGDLLSEREPRVSVGTIEQHCGELAARHGENAWKRIAARAQALVRELYGGQPAPPLADARIDPWGVVEADILAEQLAAEYRRVGVKPSKDPEWRATLNQRYTAMINRHEEQLQQRAVTPAPTPPPKLDELVATAVERAVAARVPPPPDVPPMTYAGVWVNGTAYRRGSVATHDGVLWHAESDGVTDRPGTSPAWKMMHKSAEKVRR